jgi:hypothetical protein
MNSDDDTPMLTARSGAHTARSRVTAQDVDEDGSWTLLDLKKTPVPIKFSWSKRAILPGKLGVRKDLDLIPGLLQVRGKLDWVFGTKNVIYGCSIKDKIFYGKVSLNVPARMLEYRKKFILPNGAAISIGAGSQFIGGGDYLLSKSNFTPILGMQLLMGGLGGQGSNAVFAGNGFNVKKRVGVNAILGLAGIKLPGNFELETFSDIALPQLTTRYSVQNDGFARGGGGGMVLGAADGQPLHFHVGQMNCVLRL